MTYRSSHLLLPILSLVVLGCGGGGGTTLRPTVNSVTPTGVVGITGTTVTFNATAGNTVAATTYSWSFGGGAAPNAATGAAPSVTLGTVGSYVGSVQVCNPDGCAPIFNFNFTVAEPTDPPVITAVTPLIGFTGEALRFEATASNAPATWSWNFGGGATPNTSAAARPAVVLASAGTYNATVTAANVAGISPAFDFTIVVSDPTSPPTVQQVFPENAAGESGDMVIFSGQATQGPNAWSWNFGGGATPSTSTAFQPEVQLERPGSYTGSVIASNSLGDSAELTFSYGVEPPTLPLWNQHQVDQSVNSAFAGYDIGLLDDKVVVAYRQATGDGLTIARARIAMPRKESDWDTYELDPGDGFVAGFNPSLAMVGDRLAVSHVRLRAGSLDEPALIYTRATTANPTSATPWNSSVVIQEALGATRLVSLPGNIPAIGYTGPNLRPKVATADVSTPSGPGDWNPHFLVPSNFTDPLDLAAVNGKLQVVFAGESGLRHLSTAEDIPDNIGDWTIHEPLPTLQTAQPARIIDNGGVPLIAFGDDEREGFSKLMLLRGTEARPDSASEWVSMVGDNTARTGLGIGMTVFQNRVIVSYYEAVSEGSLYELKALRALASAPASNSDWQETTVIRSVALRPNATEVIGVGGKVRILGLIEPSTRVNIFQAEDVW